ncbi:uncharacterized protein LOC120188948 [Hibiscus syriacus]|uniref:uncharacterized protein LOC120188948 n=1 Tax=Hibiscus syriacus TaxID=106335 RepID=UPI00192508FD|nr:uncharacterized protein LOC120188948 [Hibiscus syriacus]
MCISNPNSISDQTDLVAMKARLWALLRKEEHEWLQKSRLKWFKEGDINMKFFHLTASSRAKRNQISKLKEIPVKRLSVGSRRLLERLFSEEEVWNMSCRLCLIEDSSFNNSFISLIPKIDEAVSPEDYRPLSLVGSLNKIVSRVMARRMASCLKEVVGENQFAFIVGKQIVDCVLIANEVIDDLSKKKKKL